MNHVGSNRGACGLGSNPSIQMSLCRLSLLLVLFFALSAFFSGFPLSSKTNTSKF